MSCDYENFERYSTYFVTEKKKKSERKIMTELGGLLLWLTTLILVQIWLPPAPDISSWFVSKKNCVLSIQLHRVLFFFWQAKIFFTIFLRHVKTPMSSSWFTAFTNLIWWGNFFFEPIENELKSNCCFARISSLLSSPRQKLISNSIILEREKKKLFVSYSKQMICVKTCWYSK